MTAKRILTVIIILLLVFTLLPACSKTQVGTLSARMEGGMIAWDAYKGAAGYLIRCTMTDGSGYSFLLKNAIRYTPPYTSLGDHLYQISAIDRSGKVLARSGSLVYHLGAGSYADPIEIGNVEELLAIGSGSYAVTFGKATVQAPLCYKLIKDLDLSGTDFSPIGVSDSKTKTPFRGVFDGNGHKITGLHMTKCNNYAAYGLFSATEKAVVKNLTLEDASMIYDKNSGVSGKGIQLGLLIGSAESTYVDNCHVTGTIDVLTDDVATIDDYRLSVGGVVGCATSGAVTCCSFSGEIKAQYGWVYAGGIVGESSSTSPKFALLNCAANAAVEATGTAYDPVSSMVSTYVRAGVIGGSLVGSEQLSALLAVGTASAYSYYDGADANSISAGVIGKTVQAGKTNSTDLYHIYYDSDKLPAVIGTTDNLGKFQKEVHPLTEAELRTKASYAEEEGYGLDFGGLWTMTEGSLPTLSGVGFTANPPVLNLSIRSEKDTSVAYDFELSSTFIPASYELYLSAKYTYLEAFQLDSLLNSLNLSHPIGSRIRISAEGIEDLVLTIGKSNDLPYLTYGTHAVHEKPAEYFGGYKIVDISTSILKTYDYTTVDHLTVTLLPAESGE